MKKIRSFLKQLGPGFITGASDDDPSGIGTYAQTGAQFGYSQLWTALFSFPFMTVIQEMCGRIGIVTGKGLAGVMRHHYPRPVLYFAVLLLVIANTINIGANLGAMAASAQLLVPVPFIVLLIGITVLTLFLVIFVSYKQYARFLKYLTLSLFAYVIAVFTIQVNWQQAIQSTIFPNFSFDEAYIMNIVAIFGTSISPYLFFWQAGEEVEEEVAKNKLRTMGKGIPHVQRKDIRDMRVDTVVGMFFSQIIMFFIIVTTASTLHVNGVFEVKSADDAAKALQPVAGDFSSLLFALGIVGTGFLAIPVLAGSASYAFSEAFGWKEGLYRKFTQAHGFYGVIIAATIIGFFINFSGIAPFQLLYYTAVVNGIAAPPLMLLILLIANNGKIMGKYTNSLAFNILGAIITGGMGVAAILLLINLLT